MDSGGRCGSNIFKNTKKENNRFEGVVAPSSTIAILITIIMIRWRRGGILILDLIYYFGRLMVD